MTAADGLILHTRRVDPFADQPGQATFLLVHGLASNATLFGGVARALAVGGHSSVAVDQRGHGRSGRPGRTFAPEVLRDDLLRVIDHHRLARPVVVGQSWGGNVVLDLAAAHPDRVAAAVAIDGGVIDLAGNFPDLQAALDALRPPPLAGTPYTTIESAIRTMHHDWPEDAIQAALANFVVRDDGTVEPRLALEEHLTILRTMWDQHPLTTLAGLTVPTLLLMVTSAGDDGWSATKRDAVERAASANPLVAARWLEGYEHDVHAQAPALVAGLVTAWLEEVSA